jgi:hypothetical protein
LRLQDGRLKKELEPDWREDDEKLELKSRTKTGREMYREKHSMRVWREIKRGERVGMRATENEGGDGERAKERGRGRGK